MSEQEKAQIVDLLKTLPENKREFVYGYAAGVASAYANDKQDEPEKTEHEK